MYVHSQKENVSQELLLGYLHMLHVLLWCVTFELCLAMDTQASGPPLELTKRRHYKTIQPPILHD